MNLGVRWEYDGTLSDKYGNLTNVWESQVLSVPVPGTSPATGTLAGYVVPSNFQGPVPAGVLKSDRNLPVKSGPPMDNFGPRVGFAWQPLGSGGLVLRRGAGLFYDRIGGNLFVHSVEQGNPYAVTLDYAGSGNQPASLQQLFPNTPLSFVPRWVNFATGRIRILIFRSSRRVFTRRWFASTTLMSSTNSFPGGCSRSVS